MRNGPRLNGGTRRNLVRAALQTAPPTSVVSGSGRYTGARDQVCQLIFSPPVHVLPPFGDISDMPVRMFAALGGARRRCSTLARIPWMSPVERMRQLGQAVGPWHPKQCLWPRGRQVRFSGTGAAGHAVSCSKLCMAARLSAAVGRTACCDIMCDCQCAQVSRISTEAALDVLCACPTQPTRGQLSGDCRADDTGGRANGTFSLWTLR